MPRYGDVIRFRMPAVAVARPGGDEEHECPSCHRRVPRPEMEEVIALDGPRLQCKDVGACNREVIRQMRAARDARP